MDAREARLVGQKAVDYAISESNSGSVAIKRIGNGANYGIETVSTELSSVARETKSLPAEYINEQGNNILDSYREYVEPLVGKLPELGFLV